MARPQAVTEEVRSKLEQAFLMGCADKDACLFADISPATLYNYQKENSEFLERKGLLKRNPFLKSKIAVLQAIENGNVGVAQWYLEKRDKQFAPAKKDDVPQINIFQILTQIKESNGQLAHGQIREVSEPVLVERQISTQETLSEKQDATRLREKQMDSKYLPEVKTIRDDLLGSN